MASCGRLDNLYLPPSSKLNNQNFRPNSNYENNPDSGSTTSLNNIQEVPSKYSAPSGFSAGNSAQNLDSASTQDFQNAPFSNSKLSTNTQYRTTSLYNEYGSGSLGGLNQQEPNQFSGSKPSTQYGAPFTSSNKKFEPSTSENFERTEASASYGAPSFSQNQKDPNQLSNKPSEQYGAPFSSSNQKFGPSTSQNFGESQALTTFGLQSFNGNQKVPSAQYGSPFSASNQISGFTESQNVQPQAQTTYPNAQQPFKSVQNAASNEFGMSKQNRNSVNLNQVPILRLENTNFGDGTYQYAYETADGINAEEQGDARGEGTKARGAFSYTSPEGQQLGVTYIADENGYQPQGAHLPTPPPVPEAILRSLEFNRQTEGQDQDSRDGGYDSEKGNYNSESRRSNEYREKIGIAKQNFQQQTTETGYQYGASQQPNSVNYGALKKSQLVGESTYQDKQKQNLFSDQNEQQQSLGYKNRAQTDQFKGQSSELNQNKAPGRQALAENGGYTY